MSRTIEVRYFASLTDLTGRQQERVDLPDGATVEDLWRRLVERYPRLGELSYRPMVACDLEYAAWTDALDGVGEVGFLPPVSGG